MSEGRPEQTFFDTTSPVRYQASRRVALLGMGTNALLVVGQVVVGIVGHSQALVADGLHTLSDLCADLLVLFALKHSAKEADEEHPYGHARIETAVTLALGVILLLVGLAIAARAGVRLLDHENIVAPSAVTLGVSGFTILAKEALYRYTMRVARRFDSDMLKASAWHHRSDAISSIIVFVGIAGSIAGIQSLDALAAAGVALFVAKIGIELGWPAITELVDTGLDPEQLRHVRRTILSVDGVRELHLLRTRRIGGRALVDVHIIVDEDISVSEGHYISEAVRAKLVNEVDVVADALVHIDPEDDTHVTPVRDLPSRSTLQAELRHAFRDIDAAARIERIVLHYVNGKVRVELLLPLSALAGVGDAAALAARFRAMVADHPLIGSLELRFR